MKVKKNLYRDLLILKSLQILTIGFYYVMMLVENIYLMLNKYVM